MYITNWIKDRLNQKKEKLESVSYTNVKELALTKMSDSPILFVDNGKENIYGRERECSEGSSTP